MPTVDELTVTLPLPDLCELVRREVERSFSGGTYAGDRGLGRALVAERAALAIREFVAAYDFRGAVAALTPEVIQGIVRDETVEAVRKAVRRELKALVESGEIGGLVKAAMKGEI